MYITMKSHIKHIFCIQQYQLHDHQSIICSQMMSRLYGPSHQSVTDDIITMLVLALSNMPQDLFIELNVNMRLLVDLLPQFLDGTLFNFNLINLYASYDFLFSKQVCSRVSRRYPGSLKYHHQVD